MAKSIRTVGPAIHPSCAMAHARERTPDPITAVIMWAVAVQKVPESTQKHSSFVLEKGRQVLAGTVYEKVSSWIRVR